MPVNSVLLCYTAGFPDFISLTWDLEPAGLKEAVRSEVCGKKMGRDKADVVGGDTAEVVKGQIQ